MRPLPDLSQMTRDEFIFHNMNTYILYGKEAADRELALIVPGVQFRHNPPVSLEGLPGRSVAERLKEST